jgi:hypothetical protein
VFDHWVEREYLIMAKAKTAGDEELRQLKLALRYLAEQWQEQSSLQAQTLLSLLAKVESLAPGSPETLIKAAVQDAELDALASAAWHYQQPEAGD